VYEALGMGGERKRKPAAPLPFPSPDTGAPLGRSGQRAKIIANGYPNGWPAAGFTFDESVDCPRADRRRPGAVGSHDRLSFKALEVTSSRAHSETVKSPTSSGTVSKIFLSEFS